MYNPQTLQEVYTLAWLENVSLKLKVSINSMSTDDSSISCPLVVLLLIIYKGCIFDVDNPKDIISHQNVDVKIFSNFKEKVVGIVFPNIDKPIAYTCRWSEFQSF